MAFKFVVFAAFVAVARAGNLAYGAGHLGVAAYSAAPAVSYSSVSAPLATYGAIASPVAHSYAAPALAAYAAPIAKTIIAQPQAPANYDFGYSVNDPHTGDSKTQQESRHGDVVQGSYSLIEADGTKRVVQYSADAHNGFNAVVHKEPAAVAVKAVAAPLVAKYAAPAVAAYSSPLLARYSAAPAVATSYSSLAAPVVAKLGAPALAYSSPVHSYYH